MNINAINELSLKKNNFKLREGQPQPTVEVPTSNLAEMIVEQAKEKINKTQIYEKRKVYFGCCSDAYYSISIGAERLQR